MALIRCTGSGSSELSKGKYVELNAGGGTYDGSCATYTSGTNITKNAAAISLLIKPNGNNTKIDFSSGSGSVNANLIIAAIKNDDVYDVYNTHSISGTKTYAEAVDYIMVLANASSAGNLSVKVTDL